MNRNSLLLLSLFALSCTALARKPKEPVKRLPAPTADQRDRFTVKCVEKDVCQLEMRRQCPDGAEVISMEEHNDYRPMKSNGIPEIQVEQIWTGYTFACLPPLGATAPRSTGAAKPIDPT